MADTNLFTDPSGKTMLYIMYVESIKLMDEGSQHSLVSRWYVDSANSCSDPIALVGGASVPANYCSFLVISYEDMAERAKQVTMTLSTPDGDHLGVAFLDVANFSMEENFAVLPVELRNADGVFATAELHTACQNRWTKDQAVAIVYEAQFVDHVADDQAKYLYGHIIGTPEAAEQPAAEGNAANAAAEAEAQQRAAEEEEARRLQAEQEQKEQEMQREREKQRKEQEELDRQRQAEESKRKEEEDRERQGRDNDKKKQEEDEKRRQDEEKERLRRACAQPCCTCS